MDTLDYSQKNYFNLLITSKKVFNKNNNKENLTQNLTQCEKSEFYLPRFRPEDYFLKSEDYIVLSLALNNFLYGKKKAIIKPDNFSLDNLEKIILEFDPKQNPHFFFSPHYILFLKSFELDEYSEKHNIDFDRKKYYGIFKRNNVYIYSIEDIEHILDNPNLLNDLINEDYYLKNYYNSKFRRLLREKKESIKNLIKSKTNRNNK